MDSVEKVLIMLRNVDQLGNAREAIRMSKHMRKVRQKETSLVFWGPTGSLFAKQGKEDKFDDLITELLELGVNVYVCKLGLSYFNTQENDIQAGIVPVEPERIPELLLEHTHQLIIYF